MVGLIPHLLEDLIVTSAGAETLNEVRRRAGVPPERTYVLGGSYPEDEWRRLFESACEVLDLAAQDAEDAYADFFFRDALKRWPRWFELAKNSREFLERQPAIHNTFAMSQADPDARRAVFDKFRVDSDGDELITRYCSLNSHCRLYTSLAQRIIDYYGDRATVAETRCMKQGDDECEIHIRWEHQ